MTKAWLIRLIVAGGLLAPLSAMADPSGPRWKPELGLEEGLTFGGGNLLVSQVTGQPSLTPDNVSLYAGDTFFFQGYYRQAIGRTGLSFKVAAGGAMACQVAGCPEMIFAAIFDSSGPNYGFYPATADLAVEYAWEGGRIGYGRTVRFSNLLGSSDSVYAFHNVYLKPGYGWFVEYEYDRVGLRYTHLIYHTYGGYAINGSNVGIYVHFNYHDEDWYPGGRFFDQGVGMARQELALVFHPGQWSF